MRKPTWWTGGGRHAGTKGHKNATSPLSFQVARKEWNARAAADMSLVQHGARILYSDWLIQTRGRWENAQLKPRHHWFFNYRVYPSLKHLHCLAGFSYFSSKSQFFHSNCWNCKKGSCSMYFAWLLTSLTCVNCWRERRANMKWNYWVYHQVYAFQRSEVKKQSR